MLEASLAQPYRLNELPKRPKLRMLNELPTEAKSSAESELPNFEKP
jgi:hypothetical protein